MNLKDRLQRMLQIVEEAERVGAIADLERDILLNDLREAYAELKFGETEEESGHVTDESHVVPTTPIEEAESEPEGNNDVEEEPEVEVEIIFDEEENDEEPAVAEPAIVAEPATVAESAIVENPNTSNAPTPTIPKRSALLSLYEDEPMVVLGEQFRDAPSVADTIACPKGVAESAPVVSLREAIGVADKFMFVRELFGGDTEEYEQAINALETQPSFDDCIIYIAEHYAWPSNSESTRLIMELIQRKYN